jgi:anti-sigma regulatory factor (Ser/Thr protein kinase)
VRRADHTFTSDPTELPRARRLVGSCLEEWGLGTRARPLQLVVSELFTNAIRHGRGPIGVHMRVDDERLRIEVHDSGGGHPALRPAEPSGAAIGGWGLRFVDDLVDAWGTEVTGGRTVVWFEQAVGPPAAGHAPG